MKLLTWFKNILQRNDPEYIYLCNSTDLADLETRQKQIERGQAPFQKYNFAYKKALFI